MKFTKNKKVLVALDIILNLGIILILVIVIQTWIIAPFDVSGSSMCDTLNFINDECTSGKGEKIIINEAGYIFNEPQRGDIIVFKLEEIKNEEEKYFIKRIIGLPGETVEIKNKEVYITAPGEIESTKIEEPYLNETNKGNTDPKIAGSVFEVPQNHYFVLGDNRMVSTDSRSCFHSSIADNCKDTEKAFVPEESIRGKAWLVWWPLKNIRIIDKTTYTELE